ncbi:MAG: PASTA domain-containing protein, partial [Chloroflexi bacterium]|nr:PASTA domain-containing protein [Chloroflexota bacterium]
DQPTPPVQQPLIVEPGVVPNLLSQPLQAALSALDEAQLPYLVIEVTNADSALGLVFQQSPPAGTEADDATVVTLMVSR